MSIEAFYRLPPPEQAIQHEHFERTAAQCPHCGNPREECSDPERVWYPQLSDCLATRERVAAQRRYAELHQGAQFHDGTRRDWSEKASPLFPYHRDDGVTIWVAGSDMGLGGDFLQTEPD